ncbi:hypothetical protein [Inquilinus sp. YAF38]|uniref:hypothetical protein n=1 Tax=Inquilinus sp. YAF38 TaxID=3233084 RepID=UPI003F93EF89
MAYCVTFTIINKTAWGISSNEYETSANVSIPIRDSMSGDGAGFCVIAAGDAGFNGYIQYSIDNGSWDMFQISFDYGNKILKPVILTNNQVYSISASDVGFGVAGNLYGTFTIISG